MKYTVILKPTIYPDEKGYTVAVPALPGCVTEGDTLEGALANAREAIIGYLESLKKRDLPIPPEHELFEQVEVELAS